MTSHDGSWGVLGEPGRSVFFISRRAHLLTTCPLGRRWYCRDASGARSARRIALSAESASQCCRDCGPGHHCLCGGSGTPLPPSAKTCHRQLYRRGGAKQKCSPCFLFCERETEKVNTEVIATGNIPPGSESHQQRHGPIRMRSIGLYELLRHL